jgi:hypothetical protein
MDKKYSSHAWIGSFAGRLLQLRPHMSVGSVVHCAVHSIHHAADLDPQRAAEIFVLANPLPDPATKRRATAPAETASSKYRALFGFRTGEPRPGAQRSAAYAAV